MVSKRRSKPWIAVAFVLASSVVAQQDSKAPISSGTPIELAQVASVSGADRDYGAGLRLAFDEANANGGVLGRRIHLKTIDDRGDPERAARAIAEVAKAGRAVMFIGSGQAASEPEALAKLIAAQRPVFAARPWNPEARAALGKRAVWFRPGLDAEVEALVADLASRGIVKVGCMIPDSKRGTAMRRLLVKALAKRRLRLAAAGTYPERTHDVREACDDLALAAPGAVILFGGFEACARFVQIAEKLDGLSKTIRCCTSEARMERFVAKLGAAADGCVFANAVPWPGQVQIALQDDFRVARQKAGAKQAFHVASSHDAFEGYAAGRLLLAVVEGWIADGPLRTEFLRTVRNIDRHDLAGFGVGFGKADRVASERVWLARCMAGSIEPIDTTRPSTAPGPGK